MRRAARKVAAENKRLGLPLIAERKSRALGPGTAVAKPKRP